MTARADHQAPARTFLPDDVEYVLGEIDRIDAEADVVSLVDGREIDYDYLVIATG